MNTALAETMTHGASAENDNIASKINEASAYACYWQAMDIIDQRFAFGGRGLFRIPPHWTAQLLMHKAGVPREFIAQVFDDDLDRVRRRLWTLVNLMIFAPYAAEIEELMKRMPFYADMRLSYEQIEEAETATA